MTDSLRPGDCVIVNDDPQLIGTVIYTRAAPPDFAHVEVVSVRLDSELWRPHYVASVFPAARVRRLDN